MAAKTRIERKRGESTVSRLMQQRIPFPVEDLRQEVRDNQETLDLLDPFKEPTPEEVNRAIRIEQEAQEQINTLDTDSSGFFFKSNTGIERLTKDDTVDRIILDNRDVFFTPVKELQVLQDSNGKYTMQSREINIRTDEILPTSELGEYNKLKVIIDREDHVFFFDWTKGNERIFLKHPSGGYWTFDNRGNFILKTRKIPDPAFADVEDLLEVIEIGGNAQFFIHGDREEIVTGKEIKQVQGDKNESIRGLYRLNIKGDHDIGVGDSYAIDIGGNDFKEVKINSVTIIGKNRIENVGGFKEQNIQGQYVLKVGDTLLLDAPKIILRTNELITNNQASIKEKIGGIREITAGAVNITSANNMAIGTGGNLSMAVSGSSKEVMSGVGPVPPIDAKIIRTLLGNIVIEAIIGKVDIQNLLGGLNIGLLGNVNLFTPLGSLNINIAGIAELDGTLVNLGASASEPNFKGNKAVDWLKAHTHPSGTGPTGAPLESATLIQLLSTKVFTA